jgi:hypothetical protein
VSARRVLELMRRSFPAEQRDKHSISKRAHHSARSAHARLDSPSTTRENGVPVGGNSEYFGVKFQPEQTTYEIYLT